jgi:hypothetical protein
MIVAWVGRRRPEDVAGASRASPLLALGIGLLALWPRPAFRARTAASLHEAGEIWVMNADGSSPTQLTSGGGSEPAFSADGARIAFTRGANVYTMASDGSDLVQRTTDGR